MILYYIYMLIYTQCFFINVIIFPHSQKYALLIYLYIYTSYV